MKIRKPLALGLVSGIALSAFAVAAPAFADPVSNSYALVGSDTLQDVSNALVNGTNKTGSLVRVVSPNSTTLGSFDAFGSSMVQTKSNGPHFTRPSGSGAGVKALSASIQGNTDPNGASGANLGGQVDIARSSSNWGTNKDNDNGKLLYVPFGRDAIAYAYRASTSAEEAVLSHLTASQLNTIYAASSSTVISGVTILPVLPQSNSGTRSTFLKDIGSPTVGAGVRSDATVAENDATQLKNVGEIIPFSAASWIAQSNGAAPSTLTTATGVKLGTPLSVPAYDGSGSALSPNATYYGDNTWGRETYLVVEYARVDANDTKYDAGLAALVDPTKTKSLANFGTSPSSSGAVKSLFGFLKPSSTVPTRAYATLP
jgi:hypothetical protein